MQNATVDGFIAMRSFDDSLPMALLQAREAAMRLFRPLLAKHDLTEQQWRVLRALAASTQDLEVGEIAEQTFLLSPSLTRILSNLEGRQLISRATVAKDQRRSAISLTGSGHDLVTDIAPKSETIYSLIEAAFGSKRLASLLDELTDLRASAEAARESAEQPPAAIARKPAEQPPAAIARKPAEQPPAAIAR